MDSLQNLTKLIEHCYLRKLAKSLDETDNHPEYLIREKHLGHHFDQLLGLLEELDLRKQSNLSRILSYLIILNEELKSEGPWNTEKCKQYSQKMNCTFDMIYGTTLDSLIKDNVLDAQEVFVECVKVIHQKINSDSYRYYPSLIEVYCSLVENVKDYNIIINPSTTLPISLLLIDDCLNTNKIKGLKCCSAVLQCLKSDDFTHGNYYEVIYGSLRKTSTVKNIKVTKLTLECFLLLLRILPIDVKTLKTDKTYATILEQLYTESNLHRKAVCFKFIKDVIEMHGVNCVKRSVFKVIMCDNIDICSVDAIADILLMDVLECLEVWLQHCWCVWRLSSDQKLLSSLFKILYLRKEECVETKIYNLILTLISLCTKDEQMKMFKCLDISPQLPNTRFMQRIEEIKREIGV